MHPHNLIAQAQPRAVRVFPSEPREPNPVARLPRSLCGSSLTASSSQSPPAVVVEGVGVVVAVVAVVVAASDVGCCFVGLADGVEFGVGATVIVSVLYHQPVVCVITSLLPFIFSPKGLVVVVLDHGVSGDHDDDSSHYRTRLLHLVCFCCP